MNSKVKILGRRLCSPNLSYVAVLQSVQSLSIRSIHFPYICLQVGGKKIIDKCMENEKRD